MKALPRLAALGLLAFSSSTFAGASTDELSRCLVDKTTSEDKATLVKWIFVAMSQHPSVATLTKVTDSDVTTFNQQAGALFTRLLAESCVDVAKKAIKEEGPVAIQVAFQVLGQAAAGELFSHPDVTKMMGGLEQYLDGAKLQALGQ